MARPTIVCLCGSTRFMDVFEQANVRETLQGNIVLTVANIMRGGSNGDAESVELSDSVVQRLAALHRAKIDLADEVLVINVGGYIGEATRSEIDYATEQGKVIRYWENPT